MQQSKPETYQSPQAARSRLPLYISLLLLTMLVAPYFIFPSYRGFMGEAYSVLTSDNRARITGWVGQFSFWGPLIIILAMIAQMFLLVIPGILLMVISVVAYGPLWGTVITLLAVLAASTTGYLLGSLLGPVTVSRLIGEKTEQKVAGFMEDYGFWAIFITRISPFLSNDAISFVGGLLRVGYVKFIGATLMGVLPLALLIAYFGESNNRLMEGLGWVSAVSLVAFVAYIFYDRHQKRKLSREATVPKND